MGVSIVFASLVVSIGARRSVWSKFFQPYLIIMMQVRFVVVDEHRSGDMHGVHQTNALSHSTLPNEFLNFRRDVDEPAAMGDLEPDMFCDRFQSSAVTIKVNDKMSTFAREQNNGISCR